MADASDDLGNGQPAAEAAGCGCRVSRTDDAGAALSLLELSLGLLIARRRVRL
jgi:MYXO-CTERM domain-containing protein